MSRLVESTVFFIPSRADFATPEGVEDVSFQGPDRQMLHGWWLPAVADSEPIGTVLFCHGNSGNLSEHIAFVERLPALGFNVFMFDYRGFGRSGKAGLLTRNTLFADSNAALRYVLRRDDVDPDLLFLMGHSMGAVMAVNLAAEHPARFRAGAVVAPFSSFPRVASDFSGPIGWALIRKGRAAEDAIANIGNTDMLIVHGQQDRVVRPYHGDRITKAAEEAGRAVTLLKIEEAGHNDIFESQFPTIEAIAEHFSTRRTTD